MALFGTVYSTTQRKHPKAGKILAAAAINKLEVIVAPDFELGVSNKSPEFLAKFPLGKVPSFEAATGFCLSEAAAIAHYVADSGPQRDQLLGRTAEERAEVEMWVSLAEAELWAQAYALVRPIMGFAICHMDEAERSRDILHKMFGRLEKHLEARAAKHGGKPWFVGDAISNADLGLAASIVMVYGVLWGPEKRKEFPEMEKWFHRVMAVDGVGDKFGDQMCQQTPAMPKDGERGTMKF